MKLAINLFLSLAMLALSLWLIWPNAETRPALEAAIDNLTLRDFWPYLVGFYLLIAIVHVCRSWRWHYLLVPIGVRISFARLMAVSSVGFMAILALPARLGELVRPALIRKKGHVSASAALGTVAVERIIDGLIVSLMVFGCFFALRGPDAPRWMMPTAYVALAVFGVCTIGLVFALRRPEWTVKTALKLSLISVLFPQLAIRLEDKLLDLIRGFTVLRDWRNMAAFLAWTVVYWFCNGMATWLLARGMGVDLTFLGAFATMGLVAVGISLPNSPGLVGQFQYLTMLGVSLQLGPAAAEKVDAAALHGLLSPAAAEQVAGQAASVYGTVLAYAIFIHGLQVIWYVGAGLVALATKHVSLSEAWASRKLDAEVPPSDAAVDDAAA